MLSLNVKPGEKLLELGGGAAPMLRPKCQGGDAVCVDVRPCQDASGNPTVDFTADFDEPLPIQSEEFDGVLSKFVIEHLSWRKVRQFVSEMIRVLKPGGKCVCITANVRAQLEWAAANPTGWDGKEYFESVSGILFGDQDYPENTHKNYMDMDVATEMFMQAGFDNVVVRPFGERSTDMLIEASKPAARLTLTVKEEWVELPGTPPEAPRTLDPEKVYDKRYFHGGGAWGGYGGDGYRDFPVHEVVFRNLMRYRPKNVLELGCARGYLLKRFQDAGMQACGMDASDHCHLTRVCDGIIRHDVTDVPWPWKDGEFDLCYSVAVLDHVPEDKLDAVLCEATRVSKRAVHAIDLDPDTSGDRTRVTVRSLDWWNERAKRGVRQGTPHDPVYEVEVVDKRELEQGKFPDAVLKGDGKVKLNVGCFTTMFHNGWHNVDVHDLAGFAQANGYHYVRHDVRQGLPYDTGSVDLIFSSHFFEHLSFLEGAAFLRECRRVIKPDTGAVRFVVPDADLLISRAYGIGLQDLGEISDGVESAKTRLQQLWELMLAGHASMYNAESLCLAMREAGFSARKVAFRSNDPEIDGLQCKHEGLRQIVRETLDMQPAISLFVDAVPVTA